MNRSHTVVPAALLGLAAGFTQAGTFQSADLFMGQVDLVTMEGFDATSHFTLVNQLDGVNFHNTVVAWDINVNASGGTFHSPSMVLRNRNFNPIRFTLDQTAEAVGIFNTSLSDVLELRLYDEQDQLITAVVLGDGAVTFGGYANQGAQIKWGEIISLDGNGYHFVDSLVFGSVNNVPAPGALALAGLAGLVTVRRRR